MSVQTTSSADLLLLIERAKAEALSRRIVVLTALISKEADILFPHPEVSLEQALDVAERSAAPFIAIDVVTFDAAEEVPEGAPHKLLSVAAAHEGNPSALLVRWVAGGVSYSFWAKPDWYTSLVAELEQWQEQFDSDERAESEVYLARARALAEMAASNSVVMETKPNQRKSVIERVIRKAAEAAGDDDDVVHWAARWAGSRVRDAAGQAYAELAEVESRVIDDLRKTADWEQYRHATVQRQQVIRLFLTERAGGWAPTDVLVKSIDLRAGGRV